MVTEKQRAAPQEYQEGSGGGQSEENHFAFAATRSDRARKEGRGGRAKEAFEIARSHRTIIIQKG